MVSEAIAKPGRALLPGFGDPAWGQVILDISFYEPKQATR
jgi:hypothetical protein